MLKGNLSLSQLGLFVLIVLAIVFAALCLTSKNGGGNNPLAVIPTSTPAQLQGGVTIARVGTQNATNQQPPTADLSGSWSMTVDVTDTSGVCVGEENDGPYVEQLTIVQNGAAVQVSGIAGASGAWSGSFDGSVLSFGGDKADGSGTTTASFSLSYDAANDVLAGSESWSWSGASGTCPVGLSDAKATRS